MTPSTPPTPPAARLTSTDLGELIAAFNDVTARLQRSHEQLNSEVARLTKELGEANAQIERSRRLAALGEMAAGIAHEVRNPLGSIRLYAKVLQDDLIADRPREAGVAAKIAGAATALNAVVTDVLTFSREFKVCKEPVRCGDLFDRALEGCNHDGVPCRRAVRVVTSGEDELVPADSGLLTQALVNIIRNAFEAMAECGGRSHGLKIEAARRGPGDELSITVRDTGPGVSADVVSRMFNPFFTTRGTGTGLGLAIVHRIIDAHAGRIRVVNNNALPGASRNEPGATVELILPATAIESAHAACGACDDAPVANIAFDDRSQQQEAQESRKTHRAVA